MAKYSDENILESNARILSFASSTVLTPTDIHGDLGVLPMEKVSGLAAALYKYEKKLPTVLAGQFAQAKLIHEQSRVFPFIFVQLEDGRMVSPFIVRRHERDSVDGLLVMRSTSALFRRVLAEAVHGVISEYAVERPYDADKTYDRIVAMLPENVTIHQEVR